MAALAFSAALAGCSASEANPHLLSPKLLIHAQEDGNVTLYVRSAFGERQYDRLELGLDNVTVATRVDAFSLETKVAADGFFLEIAAHAGSETYRLRARVDVDGDDRRVRIVALDPEGSWQGEDTYSLPYERILERVVT